MKEKIIKNKYVLIIGVVLIVLIVGVTIAFFQSSDTFTNNFDAGDYGARSVETFVSPTDWTPGTTTPKTLTVKNTGNICENVRVSFTEAWEDANGNALPLKRH